METIMKSMELQVHSIDFAENESKQIEGVAEAKADRINHGRETKSPAQILHVWFDNCLHREEGVKKLEKGKEK